MVITALGGDMEEAQMPWIPEIIVSKIISLTSPLDACRLATVSRAWRAAADGNPVWERFLPPNYREIISEAAHPVEHAFKKELFFRLSESILLRSGRERVSLKRSNGKISVLMASTAMRAPMFGGPFANQWSFIHTFGMSFERWHGLNLEGEPPVPFRFEAVALLHDSKSIFISWENVRRWLTANTYYAARLVFKITSNSLGLYFPMSGGVKEGTRHFRKRICLNSSITRQWIRGLLRPSILDKLFHLNEDPLFRREVADARDDGWMEIEVGRFFNGRRGDVQDEENGGYNRTGVWVAAPWGSTRAGLLVDGIELWPLN